MPNDVNYDNLSLGHRGIQNQLGTDGSLSVYNGLGRRTFYVQAQALQISGTPSNEQVSLDCPLTVSNSVTVSGPLTVGADASTGEGGVCITGDQGGALEGSAIRRFLARNRTLISTMALAQRKITTCASATVATGSWLSLVARSASGRPIQVSRWR